ncbi:MAG TPA: hypothetical protein VF634_11350, partial [Pyrinomonadaceae bacterium]
MAEFDEVRQQLGRVRNDRDAASESVALARERWKRIASREAELERAFNPHNQTHHAERERLREARERAEADLRRGRERQEEAKALEAEVFHNFAQFTDPRRAVERLHDHIPILLLPVRLETRFKTVAVRGAASPIPQLWVRVYPDDCWIDSFDPTLTETEVINAKAYWIGIWKAGGVEDQERSAWRGLVNSHGPGRAAWIVSQFQPVNVAAKPLKPRAIDVILTIATETALAVSEAAAVAAFWRDAWLADGDATKVAAAQAALEAKVGQGRAAELIAQYQPVNFADPLATGVGKNQVNVSVAMVVFAPVETKQHAWSHAPKLNVLPDRFVFIGYHGSGAPVVEIGQPVPSPLIVSPDPSAPKEDQLHQDEATGNLFVPEEMKWMTDFDRAVEVGMGFRINLTPTQAKRGFERVLVIGLRFSADADTAKTELETLFRHHAYTRTGFSIVTQGTPTNNTEAVGTGFDRVDDPDESFDDYRAAQFAPDSSWLDKRDGQWVAEYLGIDPALFEHVHHAGATDQLTTRAMNIALWPATLGYWMDAMMAPAFTRNGIEQTRDFFNRYVVGCGAIPALRIGSQPYGILPATTISRMRWITQRFDPDTAHVFDIPLRGDPMIVYLRRLYPILLAIDEDWRDALSDLSFVGRP